MRGQPGKWRRFQTELRRRKVYRTAAAYAIGVFAFWQVMDIVVPALGWPESILTFFVVASVAIGPLVVALAWIFEVRREPPHPTEAEKRVSAAGADSPARPAAGPAVEQAEEPARPRRKSALAALAPAIIAAAGLTWVLWPGRSSGVGSFEEGDTTLISQCENTTGDPNLNGLLNTALEATIRQSEYLSVLSHDRVRSFAASFLGRTPPVTIDATTATEVGIRLGYKVVIHCSIGRAGDGYLLEASIMEPREQTILERRTEQAGNANALLAAMDRLASRLRADLGESLRDVRSASPLATVTTPSLDALFSYTAATAAWQRGELDAARQLYDEALERDSLFAAAHAALGNYYYWISDFPRGAEHYQRALSRPDRLSERDRLWIEANLAGNRGQSERAVALLQSYLERWPGDAHMWYNLGTQHFRATDCDAAGVAFARALAIDPSHASSHINLASCLARLGQVDSALVHYESAFTIRPSDRQDPGLNHEFGQSLVAAGRIEEAEQLFAGQLRLTPEQQAAGRRSLGLLRVRQGRYDEARTLLMDAARQRNAMSQVLSEYRDRLYLAQALDGLGDRSGRDGQRAIIEGLMAQTYLAPGWLLRVFHRYMADNLIDQARSVLARAQADTLASDPFNRASVHAMRALLLARDGRSQEAVEEARLAVELNGELLFVEVLCRVTLTVDNADLAMAACTRLADSPMIGLWEATEPAILANHWLGQLHERLGAADEARRRYARFLSYWDAASDTLTHRDWAYRPGRPVVDARTRLGLLIER